jgi:hypothetical protein
VGGGVLYLSPVDAMIKRRDYNSDGRRYEVFPCEFIDPRDFIQNRWLSLYILYGYAAHNNKLLMDKSGHPSGVLCTQHHPFNPKNARKNFRVGLSDKTATMLNRFHKKAGLLDYWCLVSEQARLSMAELDVIVSTALQAADYCNDINQELTQCAFYDPVEAGWRFVDVDVLFENRMD